MTTRTDEVAALALWRAMGGEPVEDECDTVLAAIARHLRAFAEGSRPALHASALPGYKCADCAIDGDACPTCYGVWWAKRHPNVMRVDANRPAPSPIAAAEARHAYDVAQSLREIDGAPGQEAISRIAASAPAPSAGSVEAVAREWNDELIRWTLSHPIGADGWHIKRNDVTIEIVTAGLSTAQYRLPELRDPACARAALTALPPTTLADVPEEERDAVRWALEHTIDRFPTSDGSDKLRSFITRLDPKP